MCHTQSHPFIASFTSSKFVKSPRIQVTRSFLSSSSRTSSGFGDISNATTLFAPLSISISTNLRPTNPMPPVTKQLRPSTDFDISSNCDDDDAKDFCSFEERADFFFEAVSVDFFFGAAIVLTRELVVFP